MSTAVKHPREEMLVHHAPGPDFEAAAMSVIVVIASVLVVAVVLSIIFLA